MNYSHFTKDMTWSYSRIKTFQECPYRFYLKYIKHCDSVTSFFSEYGLFIHSIIEKYLKKELSKDEIESYYITNFKKQVKHKAPTAKTFANYFSQGLEYFKNIDFPIDEIIGIEKEVFFSISGYEFIGYIDVIGKLDNYILIIDNKSRDLKPRSNRKKATKSDLELDEYLKQLYTYSIPIFDEFNEYPKKLTFNCFRKQNWIIEDFKSDKLEETKNWILTQIALINSESDWNPNLEYFKCHHLCDVSRHCEYLELFN